MRRFNFRASHISYAKFAMLSLMLLCLPVVNASEAETSVRPKVGLVYRNLRYKFNIQYDWYNNVSNWYCADYSPYSGTDEHFVSTGIDMEYDQMDNREIPANGINIRLIPRIYMHGVFDENCSIAFPLAFRIKSAYSINDRICVLPELFGRFVIGDKSFPLLNNFIGGECYDRYVPGQLVFYGLHNTDILPYRGV